MTSLLIHGEVRNSPGTLRIWRVKRCRDAPRGWRRNVGKVWRDKRGDLAPQVRGARSQSLRSTEGLQEQTVHHDRGPDAGEPIPMRKPLTGEPYAGEPHVRFGGRGGREPFPTPINARTQRISASISSAFTGTPRVISSQPFEVTMASSSMRMPMLWNFSGTPSAGRT